MQTDLASIDPTAGDKRIINELLGGLSLAPYGIFLLLSAYAFSQGWINWETNGGPPFLGGVLALLLDKLIRWYYKKKYNFVFEFHKRKPERTDPSTTTIILGILAIVGLLAAWFVDAKLHMQIRLMPLWFGLFVFFRGIDWGKKGWIGYGLIHVLLSMLPIGMSVMPLVFNTSSNNQYFGIEGIYELSAMGIVITVRVKS